MLSITKGVLLIALIIIPSSLTQNVEEKQITKVAIKIDILIVPSYSNGTAKNAKIQNNVSAFACGVNHDKPAPSQFTNCTTFCEEFCDNNMAIEVGGTNYKSCRCTVFNNAVVNAGCCTGDFSVFDNGKDGYTCEEDICESCYGEAICFRMRANHNDLEIGTWDPSVIHKDNVTTVLLSGTTSTWTRIRLYEFLLIIIASVF